MEYRIKLEVPKDADPNVVNALKAVATDLGAEAEVLETAPDNSYGLTVHTSPDKE